MRIILSNNLKLYGLSDEFRKMLMSYLEFPNPKWLENERMNRWNHGTPKMLKFYDKVGKDGLWIPRGYIRQLIQLCRKHQIEYDIEDKRRLFSDIAYRFDGTLRPFQKKAVDIMLSKEFGTLNAPTGSGKTVMALYMLAKRSQPTIIIVHTKDLAFQWIARIKQFLGIPEEEVGLIGAGKTKVGKKITVALVQSLYKCADEVSQHIGYIIVDECHRAPSRTFTEAVNAFDSRYMLGLSATPWRRDKLSKLIFWHLGDTHHEVDKAHLVESGDILQAEIVKRETDFSPYWDPVKEYSKMLSELTSDDDRNHLIALDVVGEVKQNNGICLVLSDRKKHCETLQAILKFKYKIDAYLLTGDLTTEQRKAVLEKLKNGRADVIVATGQLVGEGFDFSGLSTLFLSTPIRFSGRVLQYLGRILRSAPGKKQARVYDYIDVKVDVLVAAAKARQQVYGQ